MAGHARGKKAVRDRLAFMVSHEAGRRSCAAGAGTLAPTPPAPFSPAPDRDIRTTRDEGFHACEAAARGVRGRGGGWGRQKDECAADDRVRPRRFRRRRCPPQALLASKRSWLELSGGWMRSGLGVRSQEKVRREETETGAEASLPSHRDRRTRRKEGRATGGWGVGGIISPWARERGAGEGGRERPGPTHVLVDVSSAGEAHSQGLPFPVLRLDPLPCAPTRRRGERGWRKPGARRGCRRSSMGGRRSTRGHRRRPTSGPSDLRPGKAPPSAEGYI